MITIAFVITALCTIKYFVIVVSACCGNKMTTPMPIGHYFGISFGNTYIVSSSIAFQVWFWFSYAGVLS